MSLPLVYALLAWQQPAPPPTAPSVPQPIARVDVKPAEYALQVGDTVRLHAVAYDSSGRVMPEAVIRWFASRSEEHTSELQSPCNLVCRLLLEKKKNQR